ncbi:transposase InsO family protein [Methylobacterium brachiatum]|uniref:Transposase InsO family protein n=1 Tax=Methylobacterium brachiatum TaxID=269660 RepID=A0AAJ1WVT3_9HYPH|nr:Mu transposase C-terminal domain-containing protein [Methylobacterium brachiatum]MCB4803709.1 Mu transposase C-terminal domain-containing protein [Methylobacterium brachiatum]MDQ0544964.1 transposase InsO family protein [Methylobacterium brachiatum]
MIRLERTIPRYELGRYDQIILPDGLAYTCPRSLPDHYVLVQVGSNLAQEITFAEFEAFRRSPKFQHNRDYYSLGHVEARARSGVASVLDLPRDELAVVLFREACVEDLIDLHADGQTTIDDAAIQKVLGEIERRVTARGLSKHIVLVEDRRGEALERKVEKRRRYVTTTLTFRFPKARTLREWYRIYQTCGCLAYALRDRLRHCGNRVPRKNPDVLALMHDHVHGYMSETRPTQKACYKAFCRALEKSGFKPRAGEDPEAYRVSFTTFSAAVRALPKFEVCVARRGLPFALRRFKAVTQTFGAHRIGELVQMDEWQVSLMSLCVRSGAWKLMSLAERKLVRRERRWLAVVLDVASRCILAMRLSRTVTAESNLLTLRMMLNDKTAVAQAAGCRTPWDYTAHPLTLRNDTGPAYVSDRFKLATADLRILNVSPPAGMPELRPHIERLFGTIRTGLMGYFTGQTFANVTDKGDYDAEARASLTLDQLCDLMILWFVDIYHNIPHENLGGKTPRQRWTELEALYKRGPVPPGPHDQRAIFGITVRRTLNNRGIRVMGLYYLSPALVRHFRDHEEVELDVRIDQDDLGWISVRIGTEWHHAKCRTPGFDGVSAVAWQRSVKQARIDAGPGQHEARAIAEEALDRIRSSADAAHAQAALTGIVLDPKRVERIERGTIRTLEILDDEHGAPTDLEDLSRGIPVTGPAEPPMNDTLVQPERTSPPEVTDEDDQGLWQVRRPT